MNLYVNRGQSLQARYPAFGELRPSGEGHTSGGGRPIQREPHVFFKVRSHDDMTIVLQYLRLILRPHLRCFATA